MAVGWRTLADARNSSFLRDGLDFIWTRCTDDKDPNRWLWQTPAINRSSISHHLLLVFSFFLFIYFLLLGRDIFYFFPVLSDDRVVHALVILHFYVPEMSGLLLIAGRKPLADNNPQRLDTHTKKKARQKPKRQYLLWWSYFSPIWRYRRLMWDVSLYLFVSFSRP